MIKFPPIRSFAKGSLIYLAGSVVNAGLPLLLLPVLTRYLSTTDYGMVATANVLTQFVAAIVGLNAYGLIARNYFDQDQIKLGRLISTSTIVAIYLSLFLLAGGWFAGPSIAALAEFPVQWLPSILFLSFATIIQNNYLALLQARKEPLRFIANQTVSNVVNMGLSIWLVVGFGMDWQGRMWALIASMACILAMSLWGFSGRLHLLKMQFDKASLNELLAFGVPLIPHIIGGWVMTMSARLFLNHLSSVAETGLFSVAYNLVSPVMMIIGAANKSYMPALFELLAGTENTDKVSLCRWMLLASALLLVGGVAYAGCMKILLPIIVGPEFLAAGNYLLWLSMASCIQGIYYIFGNFIIYSKRTSLMTWRADFVGAIVMLISCPVLIHFFGGIGAAIATMLAFAASTTGCIIVSKMAYPMPWAEAFSLKGRR